MASSQKASIATSLGNNDVHSHKDGSSRQSNDTFIAKAVGSLVNKETTSKDTKAIPGDKVCPAMKEEKSAKFLTCDLDLPTREGW